MSLFDHIAERMPGGFLIYTADTREKILHVNRAALDIFGCTDEEEFLQLVHGSFHEMVFEQDRIAVENSISEQIEKNEQKTDHVIYRIRKRDGEIRWVEDYGHLVCTEKGEKLYYVFLYDITERKLAEDEACRAEQALLCEKKRNEVKNNFIFNLSHDIRTPMNAIVGFTDLAEKHINNPQKLKTYLAQVREAGKHMTMLMDDLLELSELDAKAVHISLRPVNLTSVIEETISAVEPQFRDKNIEITQNLQEGNRTILLDVPHFQRAFINILSNAIKFTPKNGRVSITLRMTKTSESGYIRFALDIADTGIGMSPEFLPKAFDAFEREKNSTVSGLIGTGIGLTVTKRIMDVMGGSVVAQSEQGKGSTFTISLPVKLADTKSIPPQVAQPQPSSTGEAKGRILVVEDIEINRMLAETVLTESGFQVESVPDGCDAVDAIKNTPKGYYSAILMDIQMPIMNGYEATRAIRSIARDDIKNLPIIALSANARAEDKEESFECGMNAHVAKPFDVAGLLSTINKYIGKIG